MTARPALSWTATKWRRTKSAGEASVSETRRVVPGGGKGEREEDDPGEAKVRWGVR